MRFPASDGEFVLIHNPGCSKSRAVKAMLEERGIAHRELRYLDDPLTVAELEDLAVRLAQPPVAWVRSGEPAYREAQLGSQSSAADVIAAMAEHPSIIQRPILMRGSRARVGRPPEQVLELFD
ncbi:MAG: arsenate reductase [Chlamydiales bacterium]|jgi:arsenate reductase